MAHLGGATDATDVVGIMACLCVLADEDDDDVVSCDDVDSLLPSREPGCSFGSIGKSEAEGLRMGGITPIAPS